MELLRLCEDWMSVTLMLMLGYRWPEQDKYEKEIGPPVDPVLVSADGSISLVRSEGPTAVRRIRAMVPNQNLRWSC